MALKNDGYYQTQPCHLIAQNAQLHSGLARNAEGLEGPYWHTNPLGVCRLMLRISTTRDRRGDVVIKVQDQSEQPGMSRDQRKV